MTNSDAAITAIARVRALSSSEGEFSVLEVGWLHLALAMDVLNRRTKITKGQTNNAFYEDGFGGAEATDNHAAP
jgi:hypothetical protein